MADRQRAAIIGMGQRGTGAYGKLLSSLFVDDVEIVAVADSNPRRLAGAIRLLELDGVSQYTDYREVLADPRVTMVVVTTPDHTHGEVAAAAVRTGKHVLCEKPLATSPEECGAILAAARPGQVVQVGFVLRYHRLYAEARRLLERGDIGTVRQISAVDNRQGADYFRRWHRFRQRSGGLFNHKSTHLLDIMNWWAGARPEEVHAFGGVAVFQPGLWQGDRCLDCRFQGECPEYLDLRDEPYRSLYLEAETVDGYLRDTCVFTSEKTTVDHGSAVLRYENGVAATYTLSLFAPMDNRQIMVFGDGGKLEFDEASHSIVVTDRHTGTQHRTSVAFEGGGHGGSDVRLLQGFFRAIRDQRPPTADAKAGAVSCVLGLAAEHSAAAGVSVNVGEFLEAAGLDPQTFGR